MAPRRKKARIVRRVSTRNRPSSTQEVLVDTESESKEDNDVTTTSNAATTANENTPPPLTQNTANAVEALFLIKQEEQCEFKHNSANAAGYEELEDGTKVWGMTQEQREADDSAIEQQVAIARKTPPVNPHMKKRPADPPASQSSQQLIAITPPPIGTNATTAIATSSTAIVATTANLPPDNDSDDDSDEELAKTMSSNLIDDDCMLFSEEERKTLGTNHGKNTGDYKARKVATEHRFFDTIKTYGGPHLE